MRGLIAVAVVLLCGCSSTEPDPGAGSLVIQRRRWEARAIRSYDYELEYANEWFPTRLNRIEVRSGNVTRVVDLVTGSVITEYGSWPTIDSLFVRAERYVRDPERVVELKYDPHLNYLTLLTTDAPNWADDAEYYAMRNLVRK